MSKVEALKALAVAMGCATSIDEITGTTVVAVLVFMAENYPQSS